MLGHLDNKTRGSKIPHNLKGNKMYNTDDIMNEVKETNNNTEKLLTKIDSLQAQNQLLTNALEKITIRLNSIEQDLVLRD